MSFSNERGQYGRGPYNAGPFIGANPMPGGSSSTLPLLLGAAGLAVVGLVVLGSRAAKQEPRLTPHDKEVRAWEAEFPGLPWYMDQVKDARQLDMWERARDYWEKKH
jgi:hypothetical protein